MRVAMQPGARVAIGVCGIGKTVPWSQEAQA